MRNLCVLLICILLAACALGPAPEAPLAPNFQQLRIDLAKVPGAQVAEGEPMLVSFPVDTLFSAGSALPMLSGIGPLEALATLVKQSGVNWVIRVRARSGEGDEYDAVLAATRAKVLTTYFKNAGVNMSRLEITVDADPGAPLELQPIR